MVLQLWEGGTTVGCMMHCKQWAPTHLCNNNVRTPSTVTPPRSLPLAPPDLDRVRMITKETAVLVTRADRFCMGQRIHRPTFGSYGEIRTATVST